MTASNGCKGVRRGQGGAFQWVQVPPGDSLQPEAIGAVMEATKWLQCCEATAEERWCGKSARHVLWEPGAGDRLR